MSNFLEMAVDAAAGTANNVLEAAAFQVLEDAVPTTTPYSQMFQQGQMVLRYAELLPPPPPANLDPATNPEAYQDFLNDYNEQLYEIAEGWLPGGGEPIGTYDELFGLEATTGLAESIEPFRPELPQTPTIVPPPAPSINQCLGNSTIDYFLVRITWRVSGYTAGSYVILPDGTVQGGGSLAFSQNYDSTFRIFTPDSRSFHLFQSSHLGGNDRFLSSTRINPGVYPPEWYSCDDIGDCENCLKTDSVTQEEQDGVSEGNYISYNSTNHITRYLVVYRGQLYRLTQGSNARTITEKVNGTELVQGVWNAEIIPYYNSPPLLTPTPPPPPINQPEGDLMGCSCSYIARLLEAQKEELLEHLNPELAGTVTGTNCQGQQETGLYLGKGVKALNQHLAAQSYVLFRILAASCNAQTDEQTLQRIYKILGGDSWFANGDNPELRLFPEQTIEQARSTLYLINDSETDEDPREVASTNLLSLLNSLFAVGYHRSGFHRLPATLPKDLTGGMDDERQVKVFDIASWQYWLVLQLDALFGAYPIKINYKDADGNNQVIDFANVAESFAEVVGLLLSISADVELNQAFLSKVVAEAIGARTAAITAADVSRANAEFLGYRSKEVNRDVKFAVKPGSNSIKDALEGGTHKLPKFEFDDRSDLMDFLKRILVAVDIIKAAMQVPYGGQDDSLPGESIAEDRRENSDANSERNNQWREFLRNLENPPSPLRQDGAPIPNIQAFSVNPYVQGNNDGSGGSAP